MRGRWLRRELDGRLWGLNTSIRSSQQKQGFSRGPTLLCVEFAVEDSLDHRYPVPNIEASETTRLGLYDSKKTSQRPSDLICRKTGHSDKILCGSVAVARVAEGAEIETWGMIERLSVDPRELSSAITAGVYAERTAHARGGMMGVFQESIRTQHLLLNLLVYVLDGRR